MKFCVFMICLSLLFSGCSFNSEKTDEVVLVPGECGNEVLNQGEECDFKGVRSCSEYSENMMGWFKCSDSCEFNISACTDIKECGNIECNGNGACVESEEYHLIYCECFADHKGYDCSVCGNDYHRDLDGKCIDNDVCTKMGCPNYSVCKIATGKTVCICEEPYAGETCDGCMDDYYLEDDLCKGRYCHNSGLKCPEFEKCDDSSGRPECVCDGPNQDPEDCSECIADYTWLNGKCVNQTLVQCGKNPDKPENSNDIIELVKITYTDKDGWSDPEICKWECETQTYHEYSKCIKIEELFFDEPEFQFGFDDNGDFIAGNSSGRIFVISDSIDETIDSGIPFTNGRLGADGNIYFRTDKGFGMINHKTGDNFYFPKSNIPQNQLTLSFDGTVFYGDSYFSFPDLIPVLPEHQNFKAVTISDSDGSTLTVYEDGYLAYMNYKKEIVWSKQINNHKFSSFPVISSHKSALLPCVKTDVNMTYAFEIYLPGETYFDSIQFYTDTVTVRSPGVSIEKDNRRFTAARGVLKVYEVNNKLLYSSSAAYDFNSDSENIPPVIAEDGFVYLVNGNNVIAYRHTDKKKWIFKVNGDGRPETLIHKDDRLYVFSSSGGLHILKAPGNSAGPWPQAFHDFNLTGSLFEIEHLDPPSAPVALTPEDNAVFNTNSVTFSWETDSSDPNIKYTLLLRDSSGYDKVHAGPEIGLSTATVNDLAAGTYEWRVVSKDKNGSLNVSDARTFTVN